MRNRPGDLTTEQLTDIAVAALIREWGATEAEARAAIDRCRTQERRLGKELAAAARVEDVVAVYLDHGELVMGRVECHVQSP